MGEVIKCVVTYKDPFWRDRDYSGEVLSDKGLLTEIRDNASYPEAAPGLVAFLIGDQARQWRKRSQAERRAAALDELALYFGDQAKEPVEYVEQDWSTVEWTTGGYGAIMGPGTLLGYAEALREPFGRIHWAGADRATRWYGYMEGAIESGIRAADEVHHCLLNT